MFSAIKKLNVNIFSINIFLCISLALLNAFFIYAIFKATDISEHSNSLENKTEQVYYDFFWLAETSIEYLRAVTTTLTFGVLVSLSIILILLFYWGKDREKIRRWRNVGFFCDYLEILEDNRVRINNTEFKLRKKQFETLELLAKNQTEGENLRASKSEIASESLNDTPTPLISENPTQVIKRLKEELGSKILEESFITTEWGSGYHLKVNPKNIRITKKTNIVESHEST